MNYIITDLSFGIPEERKPDTEGESTQFFYHPTIKVGIEGDVHGLSLNTGTTVEITNVSGTPDQIKQYVMEQCQQWVNTKFNTAQ